jgi:exonuclease SbcD
MRLLHTADWHIGHTLAGFARDHEHENVLAAIENICVEREVDALIVGGDIFDHQNPSGASQKLYYRTLLALRRACPRMTIVITAGNHDAAGRLEAPAAILGELGVHVVGNARRIDGRLDARRHLLPLPVRGGEVCAHVLAVSYPTPACLPPFGALATETGMSSIIEATRTLYSEIWEGSEAGRDGLPVIVTGHLHVLGAIESEGAERRILVGGQHAVPTSIFPEDAAYVALGHLHKAQRVGAKTIRYSGSLIPLSATEASYKHSVTLVTLDGDDTPQIEEIALPRLVEFIRLPRLTLGDLGDNLKSLDLDDALPAERQPFVQVQVSREGLGPGLHAQIEEIVSNFPVRLVGISREKAEPNGDIPASQDTTPAVRLQDLQPLEMFRDAFEEKHSVAPTEMHERVFHEVLAAAATEE